MDSVAQRVAWLRGSTANESATCGTCTPSFRSRPVSKLGDIIHSAPSYIAAPASAYPDSIESAPYSTFAVANAGRTPMIYVGANDGMMHAFVASTGREAMAYVPTPVYKNLSSLTAQSHSTSAGEPVAHHYQVDGSPTISDAFYGGSWHTLLAGALGAGGQGVYVLDVTDPSTFTQANASSIVRWEFTDSDDADLGYSFSQPLLVKTNNGRWSIIVGNGYNNSEDDGHASSSGHAVLFVLDAQNGTVTAKIDTGIGSASTPNGLSGPIAVDTTGDGVADVVYAGDLNGNLWKFDLSSSSAGAWNVAFSGTPLFTTPGQPITVRPDVTKFIQGGYLVAFGTGRYIDTSDGSTTGTQTFYGIRDNGASAVPGLSSLVHQSVVSSNGSGQRQQHLSPQHARRGSRDARRGARRGQRDRDRRVQREQARLVHQPAVVGRARRQRREHSRRPCRVQHAHSQHRSLRLRRHGLGDGARHHERQPQRQPDLRHQWRRVRCRPRT